MEPIILCYPKCGTCQKAERWLKTNSVKHGFRPIKDENPTKEELKSWIKMSNLPVAKFFNTSGLLYKEMKMKDKVKTLSDDELIEILASNGLMVKRPILLAENKVLVGFKEEEWNSLLK